MSSGLRRLVPEGKPKQDCLTCPGLEACPLVRYVDGCVFRTIYIQQELAMFEALGKIGAMVKP